MSRTASKRIVCLANSRKLVGRCVAGRQWSDGKEPGSWVRPVSAREGREVSEYERQYKDGGDPRVLDIINIPVLEPRPEGWQTENWLLDHRFYWRKEGSYSWFDLVALLDPVAPLWIDGQSTYNGSNDTIPDESMDGDYDIGECYLTVSLGEPYQGACYKLIAAIIACDRPG